MTDASAVAGPRAQNDEPEQAVRASGGGTAGRVAATTVNSATWLPVD